MAVPRQQKLRKIFWIGIGVGRLKHQGLCLRPDYLIGIGLRCGESWITWGQPKNQCIQTSLAFRVTQKQQLAEKLVLSSRSCRVLGSECQDSKSRGAFCTDKPVLNVMRTNSVMLQSWNSNETRNVQFTDVFFWCDFWVSSLDPTHQPMPVKADHSAPRAKLISTRKHQKRRAHKEYGHYFPTLHVTLTTLAAHLSVHLLHTWTFGGLLICMFHSAFTFEQGCHERSSWKCALCDR